MSRRTLFVVFGSFAILAASGAIAALLVGGNGSSPAVYRGSPVPSRVYLPDFELRNYTGEMVRSFDLRGKVVLITFLETRCKEACPVIASQLASGLRLLTPGERGEVVALAISTHPGDDTPEAVRAFLRRHRAEGELRYLVGVEDELRPVWDALFVLSALDSGDADTHSAPVRIFARDGLWVSTLHPGVDLTPETLRDDVVTALSQS